MALIYGSHQKLNI